MNKSTTIEALLDTADKHTGTRVLSDLYVKMKDNPIDINLKAVWSDLGINYNSKSGLVSFDDSAPLAAVRQSIAMP